MQNGNVLWCLSEVKCAATWLLNPRVQRLQQLDASAALLLPTRGFKWKASLLPREGLGARHRVILLQLWKKTRN